MEYININEEWEKYKETLQQSAYMDRLNIKQRELDFMEGYMRGFEKREQKQHLIDLTNEK
jgi:hypothetical protein